MEELQAKDTQKGDRDLPVELKSTWKPVLTALCSIHKREPLRLHHTLALAAQNAHI